MAQKSAKKKRQKADQPGVLGSLPSTRPARLGRARPGSDEGDGTATATKEPARATKSSRTTKSSSRGTKARAAKAAGTKPSPRATKSSRATNSSARATKPRPAASRREPVTPRQTDRATPPRGLELVTTGAQAAGELAKIGLTVGGQVLKRAARRLPGAGGR